MKRVVITGMGALTPLGLNVDEYWRGLVEGRSGVGPITLFDTSLYSVKIAAEVKGFDPGLYMAPKRVDRTSRCSQFAIAAAKMAVESAYLDMSRENAEDVGVIIATSGMTHTLIHSADVIKTKPGRIDPLMINKIAPSMVPCQVGLAIGARGPNSSLNSACASGSDALGTALHHLRMGQAEVMLAGGSETTMSELSIATLTRVGALSRNPDPAKASRPFDFKRDGFVYGEGAAILVLETLDHALKRDAPILAELAGAGWSYDAYNDTAPDANIQAVAMKKAIWDAGVSIDEVDYINAHGTSTMLNDLEETKALKLVFGDRAYKIPVSSNKSMIGHLACAAGSVEAVAAVMTIRDGILPPTINYENPDPDCDLDYVPNKSRKQPVSVCLSNSFGMGGQNCCIVLTRYQQGIDK